MLGAGLVESSGNLDAPGDRLGPGAQERKGVGYEGD